MAHLIVPPNAETLGELGQKLAQLRYDAQIVVFEAYGAEMRNQIFNDGRRGRKQLARLGSSLVEAILSVSQVLLRMLRISFLYMQKEFEEHPSCIDLD
jgi:hypothetical protein